MRQGVSLRFLGWLAGASRVRLLAAMLAATALMTGALGAVGIGCSGSADDVGAENDAGQQDATQDQTSLDVASESTPEASTPCPLDADLLHFQPPDADINDTGATVGTCVTCIRSRRGCVTIAQGCNSDCACKEAIVAFAECVGTGRGLLQCGETAAQTGGTSAEQLAACVLQKCATECGVPARVDAGRDAPADG
jgi:hypothetical protein